MKDKPELRTGLPTGAGGPIGQDNAETWSLAEQEAQFAPKVPQGAQTAAPPPPKTTTSKTSSSSSSSSSSGT